jgi:hypothetical protein
MIHSSKTILNLLNTIFLAGINGSLGMVFLLSVSSELPPPNVENSPQYAKEYDPQSQINIETYVRQFTIEITGNKIAGSGVIINQKGSTYTAVTCHHVLNRQHNFQIKTYDGQIYQGREVPYPQFKNKHYDLSLIEFTSLKRRYPIATFRLSNSIQVSEPIFVAGFPAGLKTGDRFRFTQGQFILVSDKTLNAGYKVGYNNETHFGMSGGPVVNARGQVIAIHGLGAHPLWSNSYIYEDKSRPCPPLWQLMYSLSWGIPMEHLINAGLHLSQDSTQLAQEVRPIQSSPQDPIDLQQTVQDAKMCQDWVHH